MSKVKRVLISIITLFILFTNLGPTAVKVSAASTSEEDVINDEIEVIQIDDKLYIDNFEISYVEDGSIIEVTVKDLDTGEISIAEVDIEEEIVSVDDEEILNMEKNSFSLESISTNATTQSIKTYGPFKTNYSISVKSATIVVATIAGIAAIASAIKTAGISLAAFKSGLASAWKAIEIGGGIQFLIDGKVSGYFQYSQQVDSAKYRARNINRKVYISIVKNGKTRASKTHSYGNGGWFNFVRPYSTVAYE